MAAVFVIICVVLSCKKNIYICFLSNTRVYVSNVFETLEDYSSTVTRGLIIADFRAKCHNVVGDGLLKQRVRVEKMTIAIRLSAWIFYTRNCVHVDKRLKE